MVGRCPRAYVYVCISMKRKYDSPVRKRRTPTGSTFSLANLTRERESTDRVIALMRRLFVTLPPSKCHDPINTVTKNTQAHRGRLNNIVISRRDFKPDADHVLIK